MQAPRLLPERTQKFPHLNDQNYSITSPETDSYNCAAWAVEDTQALWWPLPEPDPPTYYWPPGARRDNTLEAFAEGYGLLGFEACPDGSHEAGYEKVAVYADAMSRPQHVARQLENGTWTSKLGDWEDIEHATLLDVESPDYGKAALFLGRRRDH